MINDYINNFENVVYFLFFTSFKIILIILVILLIMSLLILILGCLIKSNKLKSNFLRKVPYLTIGIIFLLILPYFFMCIKNYLLKI